MDFKVAGIDQDRNSRSEPREATTAAALAQELCLDGWKFALVYQDGKVVAGVEFDQGARRRVYWAVPAPREDSG